MSTQIICKKIRYGTQKNAEDNIKIMKDQVKWCRHQNKKNKNKVKRKSGEVGKMTCYYCNTCEGWHLTTIRKGIQRAIEKKYQLRDEYLRNKNDW